MGGRLGSGAVCLLLAVEAQQGKHEAAVANRCGNYWLRATRRGAWIRCTAACLSLNHVRRVPRAVDIVAARLRTVATKPPAQHFLKGQNAHARLVRIRYVD